MTILTEDQQITFAILYGSLFGLSMINDYYDALEPIIAPRKAIDTLRSIKRAQKACITVEKVLQHEFYKTMNDHEKEVFKMAITMQKDLCYKLLGLDPDKQRRVLSLINKLQNEKP